MDAACLCIVAIEQYIHAAKVDMTPTGDKIILHMTLYIRKSNWAAKTVVSNVNNEPELLHRNCIVFLLDHINSSLTLLLRVLTTMEDIHKYIHVHKYRCCLKKKNYYVVLS